ncbi:unnamed protein product [Tenebrio molitor]|nr:unnamed protein product [Tenebrio molitor]
MCLMGKTWISERLLLARGNKYNGRPHRFDLFMQKCSKQEAETVSSELISWAIDEKRFPYVCARWQVFRAAYTKKLNVKIKATF